MVGSNGRTPWSKTVVRSVDLGKPVSYNPRYKDNTIVALTFFAQHIWDLAEELQDKKIRGGETRCSRSGTTIGTLVVRPRTEKVWRTSSTK